MRVRKTRAYVGLAVAALVLGVTTQAVHAAKPIRTPIDPAPQLLDAGFACAFDVEIRPDSRARTTLTEFDDGRVTLVSNGEATVTNLDTDASVTVRDRGTLTQVYDESANDLLIESSGQTIFFFFPGDQGPFGEVGPNGGLFHVVGHVRETWDLDQDLITSFALDGQATDLCALID